MADNKSKNEQSKNFNRVAIKGRGDAVEHTVIDEITIGRDANGQITWVDFGGADVTTE